MNLSENFTLAEFCFSQTATRFGLENKPSFDQYENLRRTASGLEVIRKILNKPIIITSGFRSIELNKYIGGSEKSQHCEGEAADIICPSISAYDLAKVIDEHAVAINFDQLILEYEKWVHISFSITPRHEVLTKNKLGIHPGIII